ncbi:MAG: Rpn family recombination-promoting nuclease/putative transposase [Thiocapsa sp.]|uniref:Rpn family recombination-promoting nuclease/putative transposase n=1 Tax=Thiocapsa sp. TaxID=2024551 RepID=UPI001BCFD61A|nr:Rpn family recombination-promoting nuclease/putative transposase [Thiocapsa sp.]QVL49785.1 MAG: Rpn family recombination-promoting nuclease/putative transposase [Thiocapsa sp.]
MQHRINPKVDCVFKALLGAEENRALLIDFLNAMLIDTLPRPISAVRILDPYNPRETLEDKLTIVDVKARDAAGRVFQIEIQLSVYADLTARMLYGWADLYRRQLRRGQDYSILKPTHAIWLLDQTLRDDTPAYAHRYRMRDDQGQDLVDHGGIWIYELNKFAVQQVETEQERWLKFFNEAETLDDEKLPNWMQTPVMRQAMSTLTAFSEQERAYHQYQARQEFWRQQRSIQQELEKERAAKESERQAKEAALQAKEAALRANEAALRANEAERQAKEAALAEVARLQALLNQSGDA